VDAIHLRPCIKKAKSTNNIQEIETLMEYFDDFDAQVQCEDFYNEDDFEAVDDYRHEFDGWDDAPDDPEWVSESN